MSKKSQKDNKQGFVCLIYGGCMRLGFVRFFSTENTPEDEFEKYKDHYGDIKGRYIKVENPSETYSKIRAELAKTNVVNTYGDIYVINVTTAVKVMKDVTGVKKSSTWGVQGVQDDDECEGGEIEKEKENESEVEKTKTKAKTNKPKKTGKVTVKGKKTKPDAQNIEKENKELDTSTDNKKGPVKQSKAVTKKSKNA